MRLARDTTMAALSATVTFPSSVGARRRVRSRRASPRAFVDQTEDDAAGPAKTSSSTATKPADAPTPTLPPTTRTWRRTMRFASARWWASSSDGAWSAAPPGAACPSVSPTAAAAAAAEASRDVAEGEPVLSLPLEMGICDYQDGHPPDSWDTMSNAPWGAASRAASSRNAPSPTTPNGPLPRPRPRRRARIPPPVDRRCSAGTPRRRRRAEMRGAVKTWHAKLEAACPSALAGADVDAFAAAVSVVHSRTYGVAGEKGEGYFRALLPLADLLNHAGDEYDPEASFSASSASGDKKPPMWPPAGDKDNVAWSALDDSGTIAFAATKPLAPGDEATMSYGERSNDHFLMYYGFTPPRNPHDDVVVFQDIEHALSWHMVFHPELWDSGEDDEANARESAARAAVKATEALLASTKDGELMNAEPRLKVLPGGRADARLVSLFAAAYAGTDAGVEKGKAILNVDIDSAHADIARRCAELLRQMPTTLRQDDEKRRADADHATPGWRRRRRTERTRRKCSWTPSSTWGGRGEAPGRVRLSGEGRERRERAFVVDERHRPSVVAQKYSAPRSERGISTMIDRDRSRESARAGARGRSRCGKRVRSPRAGQSHARALPSHCDAAAMPKNKSGEEAKVPLQAVVLADSFTTCAPLPARVSTSRGDCFNPTPPSRSGAIADVPPPPPPSISRRGSARSPWSAPRLCSRWRTCR